MDSILFKQLWFYISCQILATEIQDSSNNNPNIGKNILNLLKDKQKMACPYLPFHTVLEIIYIMWILYENFNV